MKVFLAGATGVIGRSLIPLLVRAGHEVTGMTKEASNKNLLRSLGARPIVADVFDRQGLFAALRSEQFDAVINQLTSLGKGDYAANIRVRTEGTRNLIDAVKAAGIKRVIAQSYFLYAPGEGLAHEGDPPDLVSNAYGGSIRGTLAEEKTTAEVEEPVILRYGTLYGPGTWFAQDGAIADQMRRREFVATGDIMSFLHIEDAAHAAVLALTWPNGPVNIVDDEPAPATQWAPVFASVVGAPAPPQEAAGSAQRGVSNEKARRDYGWRPIYASWREGFRQGLGTPVTQSKPIGKIA